MVGDRRRLRRRRGGGRGVARVAAPLVVVAAMVVVVVGAVSQIGPASGPDRRTVDRSFATLAVPIVTQSNASAVALDAIMRKGPSLERTTFFFDLTSMASAAAANASGWAALTPPVPSGNASSLCAATMAGRARAAAQIRSALDALLGGPRGLGGGNEAAAAAALGRAGRVLRGADASWAACRRALRRAPGAARLPASMWVTDPGLWSSGSLGSLVASLVASPSLVAVHRLGFVTVSTDPAAVPNAADVAVVLPTRALRVTVVLDNEGNVDEQGIRLEMTAVPEGSDRAPTSVRVTVDMGAGDSVALSPPPLSVRPGTSYALDITATTAHGGAAVSTSVAIRVAAPPPPTTTTTTTSTTVARSTTSTRAGAATTGSSRPSAGTATTVRPG